MYDYRAPRRDMQFALHEVLDAAGVLARLGRADVDRDTIDSFLEEGARFAEQVLSPLNWQGDQAGVTLSEGVVTVAAGFKAAHEQFAAAGWPGIGCEPEFGGQGLPILAHLAPGEMFVSAAMAWRMCTGLTDGAIRALASHGSPAQKADVLPRLVAGEWTGTMCLTEPQAGTDLGLMRTRAIPDGSGGYRITGTKIYISWGEHELSSNIIHLVLAKLPDAPSGTRGISLFLVPKLIDGKRNGVTCVSVEHKMGIHGSPTCVMAFEEAHGTLIGAEHGGLACMFTMMNHARIGVGLQGLGLSERALQAARAYAQTRLQGRSLAPTSPPAGPADAIVVHPDVRRMLLTLRALTEGERLLCYYVYQLQDVELLAPTAQERAQATELVALLVPIVKAFLTDSAMETTALAMQVHGGAGFIRDTGVEQYLRDAKITCIYEGTNGIQALDLMGRKLAANGGVTLRSLLAELARVLEAPIPDAVAPLAARFRELLGEWAELTGLVLTRSAKNPDELGAAGADYLAFAGYTLLAWCWLRAAVVAAAALQRGEEQEFYAGKIAVAQFYAARVLPRTLMHAAAVRAGAASIMDSAALPAVG